MPNNGISREAAGLQRQPHLDALRGVAILLVLGRHYLILPVWRLIGWCGVDLFFVLSGFLVSGLIFREYQTHGKICLKSFWVRRTVRILPPFLAMLLGSVILRIWVGPPFDPGAILTELTWTQNYQPGLWVHTWSLAVEEHFYVLLPLLLSFLMLLNREFGRAVNPFRFLPWISLALGLVVLVTRIVTVDLIPYGTRTHLFPTHLRLDALMFGVLLAYYYYFHRTQFMNAVGRFKFQIAAIATILLIPVFLLPIEHPFMHSVGFTLTYLSAGGAIVLILRQTSPLPWFLSAVAWVGRRSYSIYLWHLAFLNCILATVEKLPVFSALPQSVLYLAGSIAFGAALYALVEAPTYRLREWIQVRLTSPAFGLPDSDDLDIQGVGQGVGAKTTLAYSGARSAHFHLLQDPSMHEPLRGAERLQSIVPDELYRR